MACKNDLEDSIVEEFTYMTTLPFKFLLAERKSNLNVLFIRELESMFIANENKEDIFRRINYYFLSGRDVSHYEKKYSRMFNLG